MAPNPLGVIFDRLYRTILENDQLRSRRAETVTVNYLCTWRGPYETVGATPPAFAKPYLDAEECLRWWRGIAANERAVVERSIGTRLQLA
jgi:hypothetical protein